MTEKITSHKNERIIEITFGFALSQEEKPIQQGVLRIRSIANVSCALLGKWLWHLGDDGDAL